MSCGGENTIRTRSRTTKILATFDECRQTGLERSWLTTALGTYFKSSRFRTKSNRINNNLICTRYKQFNQCTGNGKRIEFFSLEANEACAETAGEPFGCQVSFRTASLAMQTAKSINFADFYQLNSNGTGSRRMSSQFSIHLV